MAKLRVTIFFLQSVKLQREQQLFSEPQLPTRDHTWTKNNAISATPAVASGWLFENKKAEIWILIVDQFLDSNESLSDSWWVVQSLPDEESSLLPSFKTKQRYLQRKPDTSLKGAPSNAISFLILSLCYAECVELLTWQQGRQSSTSFFEVLFSEEEEVEA
ncbi:hypothetical protein MKW98_021696 [Papaver atlanticum]|uniref:Uncharacterized protein n=1 Tax=Papaver atlanticum TaxID=357466 RepID=A0AAD4X7B9_9MAGN|nr:hypothetical protein MKW98_021696 [Papaver atlanticum]